jgi:hypothetical protein
LPTESVSQSLAGRSAVSTRSSVSSTSSVLPMRRAGRF